MAHIVAEVGVELRPRTCSPQNEKESPQSTKGERGEIEDEDRLEALRLASEECGSEEHNHACAELSSEVHSGLDSIEVPVVDVCHAEGEWGDSVIHEQGDVLRVRIEGVGRRHCEDCCCRRSKKLWRERIFLRSD